MATVTFNFESNEKAKQFFKLFTNDDIHKTSTKAVNTILYEIDAWDIDTKSEKEDVFIINITCEQ